MSAFAHHLSSPLWIGSMQSGGGGTLALDSAYTYNSAGDATAVRFVAPRSGNLTDVYAFIRTKTGSPGNLTCELRNYNAGTGTRPGSTLHATQTAAAPASSARWVRFAFGTPYAVTANTVYWIVFGDAAGNGSDYCSIQELSPLVNAEANLAMFVGYRSTDGFASNGTQTASYQMPPVCVTIDGQSFGQPYTVAGAYASTTRKRGWKVGALAGPIRYRGTWHNQLTSLSGAEVFLGTAGPGTTPALSVPANSASSPQFPGGYEVAAGVAHRIVLTYSGSVAGQGYHQIEDHAAFAAVQACAAGGGLLISTIDDGAGGWTDEADKLPRGYLMIEDLVAPPAASIGIIG